MGQISVTVNGNSYQVACDDGQEEHIRYLAEYMDELVADLVAGVGQVGEARLLFMAGLMMAHDLSEQQTEVEALRSELDGRQRRDRAKDELARAAESLINGVAGRLETIAGRLEST